MAQVFTQAVCDPKIASRQMAPNGTIESTQIILHVERKQPLPVSYGQQGMWLVEQTIPDPAAYNVPIVWRFEGPVDREKVRRALGRIQERHEVLRTALVQAGEELVQAVSATSKVGLPYQEVDLTAVPTEQREAVLEARLASLARQPFDLAEAPLWRVEWLVLSAGQQVLALVFQHSIVDEWSVRLFCAELEKFYLAATAMEAADVPGLPIQYGDYAIWQRQRLCGPELERQQSYWRTQMAALPPVLELPADLARPAQPTGKGSTCDFRITGSTENRLRALARQEETTLFMVMLAAFQVWLYRYTGQADLVVGTPFMGRELQELESLFGYFLNLLPIRLQLDGALGFREVVRLVRTALLAAYDHAGLPLEKIVELAVKERAAGQQPLYQVMFVLLEQGISAPKLGDACARQIFVGTGASRSDLTLFIEATGGELKCQFEYSTDLFSGESAARMAGHLGELFGAIAEGGDQPISRLRLMSEAERHRLLVEWNSTAVAYPKDRCLHELIEAQVVRTPDAVAVVYEDRRLTYRQLNARANQLARHLRALGVVPDTLVGICVERSLEMVVGLLGILKAGGAYVSLDPEYPKDRLTFMVQDAATPVLLTQASLAGVLPPYSGRIFRLDADWASIAGEDLANLAPAATPRHLAYMIYTSGSTGRPKGAMNTHVAIVNRLLWMQDAYQLTPADRVVQKTPFSFDVSVWEFFWPLLTGASLIVAVPGGHRDAAYLAGLIQREQVTTAHFVPSMLAAFLEQPRLETTCASLKRVICSGEALPYELQQRFFSRLPAELHNLYGPTEAAVDVTFWPCERNGRTGIVPIGRPIANIQIYILDRHLQPVPVGVPGELHIGGIGLARGYHNRPELTAEKFIPNPFSPDSASRLYKTGDLARYLPDGNIEYLGRLDHQVKLRGFRIELGEIEAKLRQHPGVREAVVLVREEPSGEKRLVAYLTASGGALPPASALREHLQTGLPDYMIPSGFVSLAALPLTPNGKVDRRALPEPELASSTANLAPPQTPTEIALAKIWSDLLGLEQVGIHDNFFEIGGHSLFAMRLASRIQRDLNCALPLRTVFQHPTIKDLAAQISSQPAIRRQSELIHVQRGGSGPDLIFLVDEGSLGLFKLAYLLDKDFPMYISIAHLPLAALRASAQNRLDEVPSLKEFASAHVALIKNRSSRRPIILVGHCFGGEMATEVASQLRAGGEQIDAVLMLDTWMTSPGFWWRKKTWVQAHFQKFLQQGPGYFLRKSRRRIRIEKEELSRQLNLKVDDSSDVTVPWSVIERIYRQAKSKEVWQRPVTPCRGILFVSRDDWQSNEYRLLDNTLGASRWFKDNVAVIDVPGDHVTVLDEVNLPELSRCFNRVLREIYGLNSSAKET